MTVYSHSRLSTFEQCRYKYKLKYIDKIPVPIEKSIEAHLGECVHAVLEYLYKNAINGKTLEMDEVIEKFSLVWAEKYSENMKIVRDLTEKDYFNKGVKFLIDYYLKHKPFQDGTIETEKRIWISLEKSFPHKIIGYIDRLVFNKKTGEYEIHDYKTANSLPNKEKFERDRQLALYSIAIKETYGREVPVLLKWHYLNYDLEITSKRTNEDLEKLKKEIIELIKRIEKTNEFPPQKSPLCDWCEYKPYCKAWGNSIPEEFVKKEKQGTIENIGTEKLKESFPTSSKYIVD
ncbi:MAG: PD-(D/E)XK nuclease family protein [Nanoarchaeota archaeon]|nr:PD-(D/E)XK nuclease family protein [Nanoarchaeota archaeon]